MLSPLVVAVVDSNTATIRLADVWHASVVWALGLWFLGLAVSLEELLSALPMTVRGLISKATADFYPATAPGASTDPDDPQARQDRAVAAALCDPWRLNHEPKHSMMIPVVYQPGAQDICSRSTERLVGAVMNSVCSVRIVERTAHGWHTRPIARRRTRAHPRAKLAGSLMNDAPSMNCGPAADSSGGRR